MKFGDLVNPRAYQDLPYLDLLNEILNEGLPRSDRTGVGTIGVFGARMRFDLTQGFPLLTTKKLHWPSIIWELLWFVGGGTNVKWLQERGVTIWDEWADENGELGPVYGHQWRNWQGTKKVQLGDLIEHCYVVEGIDQLKDVVERIKKNPTDRRLIVSAWNVDDVPKMKLPPCHLLFQFYVRLGQFLDCQMYQRSCDTFLGVPFNIASYAALVHMIAHITDLAPGDLIWVGGDTHIYHNHREQVDKQLARQPRPSPTLRIREDAPKDIDGDWHLDHFILEGYDPHPGIKAPVAV